MRGEGGYENSKGPDEGLLLVTLLALLGLPAFAQEHVILIKNATILTITNGKIENGSIVEVANCIDDFFVLPRNCATAEPRNL